jgi:hypothetical protein
MSIRTLLLATGFLAASFTPAFCDNITASVLNWDPVERTITLEDFSKVAEIAKTVNVPNLKSGDVVTVDYNGSENGIDSINSITIITDVAKRQVPVPKRG